MKQKSREMLQELYAALQTKVINWKNNILYCYVYWNEHITISYAYYIIISRNMYVLCQALINHSAKDKWPLGKLHHGTWIFNIDWILCLICIFRQNMLRILTYAIKCVPPRKWQTNPSPYKSDQFGILVLRDAQCLYGKMYAKIVYSII